MKDGVEIHQITFSGNPLSTLRKMAEDSYRSEENVIKVALGLYQFCLGVKKRGGSVLIQEPDGTITKSLVIP